MDKFKINFLERIKNIDFNQIREDEYKKDRQSKNLFSYWYPRIKDCGIKMAKSWYTIFSLEEYKIFCDANDSDEIKDKFIEIIKSKLGEFNLDKNKFYNIKNGCFSNKFDNCNVLYKNIPEHFFNTEQISYCQETSGVTEFVVREFINYNPAKTPTIYNGLPFRTEFRAFVDFDTKEFLYMVNYWNYDYCYPNLYDLNDKIIFDYMKEEIENSYQQNKDKVEQLIKDKILNKSIDLSGQWSIDILMEENKFYLIDMAEAYRSAYWDKAKIKRV